MPVLVNSKYPFLREGRLRHPDDQPGIGLILCKTKSPGIVE